MRSPFLRSFSIWSIARSYSSSLRITVGTDSASNSPYFRLLKRRGRVPPSVLAIIFPLAFVVVPMSKDVDHVNPLILISDPRLGDFVKVANHEEKVEQR